MLGTKPFFAGAFVALRRGAVPELAHFTFSRPRFLRKRARAGQVGASLPSLYWRVSQIQ